jgi:hypothetical protein
MSRIPQCLKISKFEKTFLKKKNIWNVGSIGHRRISAFFESTKTQKLLKKEFFQKT